MKKDHRQSDLPNELDVHGSVVRSEEFVRKFMTGIVTSAIDAIISVDANQRIILFNGAAEKMFGCPVKEALGQPLDRFIPQRFHNSHREHIRRFDRTNATHRQMGELGVIFGLRTQPVEEFPIEASISQIESDGEKFFTVILRDITKRQTAAERLLEHAALLDVARDAIIVRDMEDRIVFWNKSATRIYGWEKEEVLGRAKRKLLYPKISQPYREALKILFECGEWTGELTQAKKNGGEIVAECRWTLVKDEHGDPQSILSINSDVTERKTLEAKFLRAQRLESIGILAGGIAHDLNNVLAPILIAIPSLEKEVKTDKSRNKLEIIRRNAHLGADIIQQLLLFVRGEREARITINPGESIQDICKIIRRSFPDSIEIGTNFPEDIWAIVADPTQFDQVLMNLCVNARDAMPQGGTLRITAENAVIDERYVQNLPDARPGRFVKITVEDNGTGIASEIVSRIFDPFFTTKKEGKGTGLGLATVLKIVTDHDGFIEVDSAPGRGASFKIHLPTLADEVSFAAGSGELILVAETEATFRELLKSTLKNSNYRVLTASDLAEAISLCVRHKGEIKAILLNGSLRAMDALATIRAIYEIDPDLPVIVTGELPEDYRFVSVKAILKKPYTAKKLLRTLADVVDEKISR